MAGSAGSWADQTTHHHHLGEEKSSVHAVQGERCQGEKEGLEDKLGYAKVCQLVGTRGHIHETVTGTTR